MKKIFQFTVLLLSVNLFSACYMTFEIGGTQEDNSDLLTLYFLQSALNQTQIISFDKKSYRYDNGAGDTTVTIHLEDFDLVAGSVDVEFKSAAMGSGVTLTLNQISAGVYESTFTIGGDLNSYLSNCTGYQKVTVSYPDLNPAGIKTATASISYCT